ncbi:MAG: hypothetical protein AB7V32_10870 [Candidatus Berkiella sp.]
MKNLKKYNEFVQSLELKAQGGLFFHRINEQIYITDYSHRLLGIWELDPGHVISFKDTMNQISDQISSSSS